MPQWKQSKREGSVHGDNLLRFCSQKTDSDTAVHSSLLRIHYTDNVFEGQMLPQEGLDPGNRIYLFVYYL